MGHMLAEDIFNVLIGIVMNDSSNGLIKVPEDILQGTVFIFDFYSEQGSSERNRSVLVPNQNQNQKNDANSGLIRTDCFPDWAVGCPRESFLAIKTGRAQQSG